MDSLSSLIDLIPSFPWIGREWAADLATRVFHVGGRMSPSELTRTEK